MAGRSRQRPLFIDHDFPPDTSSLTTQRRVPRNMRDLIWKRPKDFCRNPKFIVHGATRFDLDQGKLGNCWFIAAAAVVATNRELFQWCVPHDQGFDHNYGGKFRFHFWRRGQWVQVVIDDYLPTDENGLVFAHNREEPNEFWAALLEKAYAKFNGCYEALEGGRLEHGLVSFSGGQTNVIRINNRRNVPNNLDEILWRSWSRNSFIGCSIWDMELEVFVINNKFTPSLLYIIEHEHYMEFEQETGLIMGHAYSITSLQRLNYGGSDVFLCRLRNPWGRREWNGAWSDESSEIRNLSPRERRRLGIVIENDGEFWMSIDDVIRYFDEIQICHLQSSA